MDAADLPRLGAVRLARRAANRDTIARVSEKLNIIFDSGVPFFTKDAIQDTVRQLDDLVVNPNPRAHTLRKFTARGVDGSVVEVVVPLGRVHPYRDLPDVDIVEYVSVYPLPSSLKATLLTAGQRQASGSLQAHRSPDLGDSTFCRRVQHRICLSSHSRRARAHPAAQCHK